MADFVKWAGNFDCTICGSKRLLAESFSKKMMENHRKSGKALKCKSCVAAALKLEQDLASAKAAASSSSLSVLPDDISELTLSAAADTADVTAGDGGKSTATAVCSACLECLPLQSFNKSQLSKGTEKQRCRVCIEAASIAEKNEISASRVKKMEDAKAFLAVAQASGTSIEKLKAASLVAALEAEIVTGISVKTSKGGGGRGGSGGRGSSSAWKPKPR
jgi:hypothetical protein